MQWSGLTAMVLPMFRYKWVVDRYEAVVGPLLRLFGIDLSILLLGNWRDWRVIDLRIPCNYGVYLQIWFILISIGRLPDDSIYKTEGE